MFYFLCFILAADRYSEKLSSLAGLEDRSTPFLSHGKRRLKNNKHKKKTKESSTSINTMEQRSFSDQYDFVPSSHDRNRKANLSSIPARRMKMKVINDPKENDMMKSLATVSGYNEVINDDTNKCDDSLKDMKSFQSSSSSSDSDINESSNYSTDTGSPVHSEFDTTEYESPYQEHQAEKIKKSKESTKTWKQRNEYKEKPNKTRILSSEITENQCSFHHQKVDTTPTSPAVECNSLPCLLYTSPSPRDGLLSRMPSSA